MLQHSQQQAKKLLARLRGGEQLLRHFREEIQRDALLAWRTNPLAKRIVSLTTQYVIGEGIKLESRHAASNASTGSATRTSGTRRCGRRSTVRSNAAALRPGASHRTTHAARPRGT